MFLSSSRVRENNFGVHEKKLGKFYLPRKVSLQKIKPFKGKIFTFPIHMPLPSIFERSKKF